MTKRKTRKGRKLLGLGMCAFVLVCGLFGMIGCTAQGSGEQSRTGAQSSVDKASIERTFVDSLGRTVELPQELERVAPSGFTAQQVLLTIAPEKMVGLSQALNDAQIKIFGESFRDMPVLGAVLGATDSMNREAIAEAAPQVIIDTGEAKKGVAEDLDALQEQIGIPCVFIETTLDKYGSGYETLGELLGDEERGSEIGTYLQHAYDDVKDVMANIPDDERASLAYIVGDTGLNAIAKTSFQGQVVDLVANNVVVVEKASGKGDGNEISLEQMALWNPEVVVFQKQSAFDVAATDPAWQTIAGIAQGKQYLCPADPWCWLNNPPTVNQMLGLQWLPRLLYPDAFDESIPDITKAYFKTMYHYDLSDEELSELLTHAMPMGQ